MGEKIKDLHEISIGSGRFMVELNEGYLKNEGRLIHIQNKHFRYLLKEKQYLKLAATVLRAREEMKYYKDTAIDRQSHELAQLPKNGDLDVEKADELCKLLTQKGIDYRLVEVRAGFCTILINDECYSEYKKVMKSVAGMKKTVHPYSEKLGYHFLYQMRPYELYKKDGFFYEFYFKLPCTSLTPKSYIPLDKQIQDYVFEQAAEGEIKKIDDLTYSIYRICLAIFEREAFTDYDAEYLSAHKEALDSEDGIRLLEGVFFRFTGELIQLIKDEKYTEIISAYYAFSDY